MVGLLGFLTRRREAVKGEEENGIFTSEAGASGWVVQGQFVNCLSKWLSSNSLVLGSAVHEIESYFVAHALVMCRRLSVSVGAANRMGASAGVRRLRGEFLRSELCNRGKTENL